MSAMSEIVKKVLERAAAEIVEELELAKDIQEDVLAADERDQWWQKVWALEEMNGALKGEHDALKSEHEKFKVEYVMLNQAHAVLTQKYVQLEAVCNQLMQANKEQTQNEETMRNTLGFLQQTIQTSNSMNMTAVAQLAQYKHRVAQLEGELQSHVLARARDALFKSMGAAEYTPK
jgi:hypothetical protein